MHFWTRRLAGITIAALGFAIGFLLVMASGVDAQSGASLWRPTDGPTTAGGTDRNSVELGTRFYADADGQVTALRFWKASGAPPGAHTGNLWTSSGTLLATVAYTGETASGWQQQTLSAPISITAGTTYVASYHTVGYSVVQHYFDIARDVTPLHAATGAGVFRYGNGPSLFPSDGPYLGSNYWADVVFNPSASTAATTTPTAGTTATPSPTVAATATPSPTTTPAATSTPSPGGYTCTEVVGFSVTNSWYTNGFIQAVPDPSRWQLRWFSGGSIDQWAAGASFSGWYDPANLITHCASGSSAPGRVVLNISGEYSTDTAWWRSQTQQAINYIQATYSPSAIIVLQPPVGGPSSSLCSTSDPTVPFPWVRATYNWPYIVEAIHQLSNGSTILQGPFTETANCGDYVNVSGDSAGHLVSAAQLAQGHALANWYSQSR